MAQEGGDGLRPGGSRKGNSWIAQTNRRPNHFQRKCIWRPAREPDHANCPIGLAPSTPSPRTITQPEAHARPTGLSSVGGTVTRGRHVPWPPRARICKSFRLSRPPGGWRCAGSELGSKVISSADTRLAVAAPKTPLPTPTRIRQLCQAREPPQPRRLR